MANSQMWQLPDDWVVFVNARVISPPVGHDELTMATTDKYPTITVAAKTPAPPIRPPLQEANVTAVGQGITVKGQLTATEHVIIEGAVEGKVVMPDYGVAISAPARVRGEICARTVTILGYVDGNVTASSLIELRSTAIVSGRLVSPSVLIEDGAQFNGTVAPDKTDAAIAVVRHRLQQPSSDTHSADTE